MRWERANQARKMHDSFVPDPIRPRPIPKLGVVLIEFDFPDGLKLGYAEDKDGLLRVRFDRVNKVWTSRMHGWMAERLDDAAVWALNEA